VPSVDCVAQSTKRGRDSHRDSIAKRASERFRDKVKAQSGELSERLRGRLLLDSARHLIERGLR
jgi:hypothetical protein